MFLSRIELGARATEQESFWREVSHPYGAHQALWRLLGRGEAHKRDFLYRAEPFCGRPSFLVLSTQRPEPLEDGLWAVEPKPFAPALRPGQRLGFRLRASPVVRRGERVEGKAHSRVHRHDVVRDRATQLAAEGSPLPEAADLVREAGTRWLEGQAQRAGFRLVQAQDAVVGDDGLLQQDQPGLAVRVDGYRQHRIVRRGETPIRFSTLEFEGLLEVADPGLFLAKVTSGFGPQKAFGCGLMLLRRA